MSGFKIIKDKYNTVFRTLLQEYPVFFPEPSAYATKEANTTLIDKDLNRTCYVSENLDLEAIKNQLLQEFFKKELNNYLQGDFEGGLAELYYKSTPALLDNLTQANQSIRICYTNDNNELCGVTIILVGNEVSGYKCSISMYRNVADTPENRDVVYISNLTKTPGLENIDFPDVLKTIKETLQSSVLYEAIAPILINENFASKAAFDNLDSCITPNSNSYSKIQDLNKRQKAAVADYRQETSAALDLEKEVQLKQSFFSRNRYAIGGFSMAIVFGAAIIAGIVLFASPLVFFSIPLAAGAFALAIAYVGVLSMLTAKLISAEKSLKQYVIDRDVKIQNASENFKTALQNIPPLPGSSNDEHTEHKVFGSPYQSPDSSDAKIALDDSPNQTNDRGATP